MACLLDPPRRGATVWLTRSTDHCGWMHESRFLDTYPSRHPPERASIFSNGVPHTDESDGLCTIASYMHFPSRVCLVSKTREVLMVPAATGGTGLTAQSHKMMRRYVAWFVASPVTRPTRRDRPLECVLPTVLSGHTPAGRGEFRSMFVSPMGTTSCSKRSKNPCSKSTSRETNHAQHCQNGATLLRLG